METNNLLVELGCEELPPLLLQNLSQQLADNLQSQLKKHSLIYTEVVMFCTPRRLAVLIKGLPKKQSNELIEKKGPNTKAPPQAISGFANSLGVRTEALVIKEINQLSYYTYCFEQQGQATIKLLSQIIPIAIRKISHDRMMGWGKGDECFIVGS